MQFHSPHRVDAGRVDEVVDVLCEAFYDYPVMRHVVGEGYADYNRRLSALVRFFVMRSVRQNAPMLGITDGDALVSVATVTIPFRPDVHPGAEADREHVWRELGDQARVRYDAYKAASHPVEVDEPHYYLNLIGVRTAYRGAGTARPLMEAVQALSGEDAESRGVALTTELARNVPMYEHFGYRRIGHVRVCPGLETWGFFRPVDA